MPDLRPRPLAWCAGCDEDVEAVQAWRKGRTIGKYGRQYDYRCRNSLVEPYTRPAAAAIDWTNLGTRIGDRKRPLAAKTISRIEKGLPEYPQRASLLTLNHTGHDGRAMLSEHTPSPPAPARSAKACSSPAATACSSRPAEAGTTPPPTSPSPRSTSTSTPTNPESWASSSAAKHSGFARDCQPSSNDSSMNAAFWPRPSKTRRPPISFPAFAPLAAQGFSNNGCLRLPGALHDHRRSECLNKHRSASRTQQ